MTQFPFPSPTAPQTSDSDHGRTLDSATLFGGHNEIQIAHKGQIYRLRITRQGKLILTK